MTLQQEIERRRDRIDRIRPILIGAASRSGTTLLGAMLGVGPHALAVPEANFKHRLMVRQPPSPTTTDAHHAMSVLASEWKFRMWRQPLPEPWPDPGTPVGYRDLLAWLALGYGERTGKPDPDVWVDHTPTNLKHGLSLARLLPDARFIHLIRDGRACMASWRPLDWGPNDPHEAAMYWTLSIAYGLAAEQALGCDRIVRVRYEDLLRDPEGQLRRICEVVDLPYDDAMLHQRDYEIVPYTAEQHAAVTSAPDPARIDAWRQRTATRDVEIFEALAGDVLEALGYTPDVGFGARIRRKDEHAVHALHGGLRRLVLDRVRRQVRRRTSGPAAP